MLRGECCSWSGSAPKVGRFRVRFLVVSLETSTCPIPLSACSSPGVHSASNINEYQRLPWGKQRPAGTADNSAGQAVPNVKVRMEDQLSISPPHSESSSLHRKTFPLTVFIQGVQENNINTRVGTLIVGTTYLQLIQNRYMFRSFTVLQCNHQHCVQSVASDVEVVGYL